MAPRVASPARVGWMFFDWSDGKVDPMRSKWFSAEVAESSLLWVFECGRQAARVSDTLGIVVAMNLTNRTKGGPD